MKIAAATPMQTERKLEKKRIVSWRASSRLKRKSSSAHGVKLNVASNPGRDLAKAPTHVPTMSAMTGFNTYRANRLNVASWAKTSGSRYRK